MNENHVGINGICNPELYVYKIFSDQPEQVNSNMFKYTVDPVTYRRALAAAADNNVQVWNLSVAGRGKPDSAEEKLLQSLFVRLSVVCWPAGS